MIYNRHNQRVGFTIVEMCVILAIISIVVSISIPNISRYIYKIKVNGATNALMSRLKLTRQKAIAGMTRYVFNYDISLNTYQMFRDDNENWALDTGEEFSGPYDVSEEHPGITLGLGVQLPNPVAFMPKGTVIAQNGSPAYGDFILYSTRGDTVRVIILQSGFIKSEIE